MTPLKPVKDSYNQKFLNLFKMLFSFFFLSISIIVSLASANPDEITSQSPSDVIDYSTDMIIRKKSLPLLLEGIVALTGYESAVSNAVEIISWLFSYLSYIITAAIVSFCRLSNVCLGLEEYLPQTRAVTMVPEYLETAEKFLLTVVGNFLEGSST